MQHDESYTYFVGSELVHKMGDGEVVQLILGGGDAYFKFWPIGGCLFESEGGELILGFTVAANFPFCFGILIFSVSNLILTLFRNIAKSGYHHREFQKSLRNVVVRIILE